MYFLNVIHLKQFYASGLGKMVSRVLTQRVRKIWPATHEDTMLAIGYPLPLLPLHGADDNTLAICMPAGLGALAWPPHGGGQVFLSHEGKLPLPDNSVNRVLLMHTLECTAELSDLMHELWRVLTPSGRMIAIVPNRLSLWARASSSPFGYGTPFSARQIRDMMEQSKLTYLDAHSALFFPPLQQRWLLKIARLLERVIGFVLPICGGVWIVEAEKQIYASIKEPAHVAIPRPIPVGVAQPTARVRNVER